MKTICALMFVVPSLAAAAEQMEAPLTLSRAVALALTNHPEIQIARQRIEAASGSAAQSRLWPNPELELAAEDVPVTNGGLSESKLMVGLSQTVLFPGKQALDWRARQQDVHAAEAEYRLRQRQITRDVTIAFWRALAAQMKSAVASELVAVAETLTDATRQRVATGAAATPDQLRAEIELERARLDAATIQRELTEARRELTRWIGQPVTSLAGDLPETVATTETQALAPSHPQLAIAAAQRQRAELELRRARLEPWPDVTLGVAGGRDRAMDETMLEFRVSVPLPIFDRAQGRRREARALAEIARLEADNTAQQLAQDRDIALARLLTAQMQADTYRTRILPKAEEALRLVRQGYEAGKFGLIDLLDTQRTAFETRLAYYDQLLELNTAAAELAALASEEQP